MRFVIARRCSILLAGLLLLWASQASDTRAGAQDARDQRAPAVVAPAATSFFWYSPPLYTNSTPQRISTLAFDPATAGFALAASLNGGDPLQRTTDHGITWSPLVTFRPNFIFYGSKKQTYYAFANGLYKTSDGGGTWALQSNSQPINRLWVHPANSEILYANNGFDLFRSLDGGKTWTSPASQCACAPEAFSLAIGTNQPNVLYAGRFYDRGGGVARSADQGATWQEASSGLPISDTIESIIQLVADPRDANVVFALTETGNIYKTTNGGGQWVPFETGLPADPIHALTMDDKHAY